MAANPNPSRITNELWYFWEEFKKFEPKVLLSGIYADKPGYHNTRAANMSKWPGNYSYDDYPADRLGPSDKAAAIDLTFPDAQAGNYTTIAKYSKRLLDSGKDKNDSRLDNLREFYGNADSDTEVEGWDYQAIRPASSDKTHLWHIHISFIRGFVTHRPTMDSLLAVLKGVPNRIPVTPPVVIPTPPVVVPDGPLTVEDYAKVVAEVWKYQIEGISSADTLSRTMLAAEKAALPASFDELLLIEKVRARLGL